MSDKNESPDEKWKPTLEEPYSCAEEKEHLAAIGMVANEWAWLEFRFDLYTFEMLGIEEDTATCLSAQVAGPARKLSAYISACRLRGSQKAGKALENLAKETANLGESRNRFIHDSWVIPMSPNPPRRFEMTARNTLRKGTHRTTTAQVLDLALRIIAHQAKFEEIHRGILAEVGTSPRTQREASP